MIRPKKLDNRGLTLVELIVGLAILALIVTPLLRTFISGAATERKSREYGEATIAAQNIAETIQAFDAKGDFMGQVGKISFGGVKPTADLTNAKLFTIQDYPYNGKKYNATLTMNTDSPRNKDEISIGTAMDAVIDMSDADNKALEAYVLSWTGGAPGTPVGSSGPALSQLTRTMTVNVTKKDAETYLIEVEFFYSGGFLYHPVNAPPETKPEMFSFSLPVTSSVKVTARDAALSPDKSAFSLFLFYNANPGVNNRFKETININTPKNTDKSAIEDFNVFLSNTNTIPDHMGGFHVTINFKNQVFHGDAPAASRVYTNLNKNQASYHAFLSDIYYKKIPLTEKLVASTTRDRYVDIVVSLFPSGSDFSGTALATLKTTKLS